MKTSNHRIKFPHVGLSRDQIFQEAQDAKSADIDWRGGRVNMYTHFAGDDVLDVAKQAAQLFFSENALGTSAFPSLKKFETDVVGWTLDLLHADSESYGIMTSGGTESIFMAMKTARNWARARMPQNRKPVVLVPYSAHPAFSKAAHFLDVELRRIRLAPDFRVDMNAMTDAIDDNVIMLVGSAPQFPHGVFDPIADIASIAASRGLWMHVDACVGGFISPFVKQLGGAIPDFDFAIPGVTSMSADLHKYGFTAKGASTLLFRDKNLEHYQAWAFDEWPLGAFTSPGFPGTRPGGPIAAAWAVMRYLGVTGYMQLAKELMAATRKFHEGIAAIEGMQIVGSPPLPVMSYTANGFDIFDVADAMARRGWFVIRSQEPKAIHLGMLTMAHVPIVEKYLSDLKASVADVHAGNIQAGKATSYGN
jgi:sphinganine-1-phosphate aldolase